MIFIPRTFQTVSMNKLRFLTWSVVLLLLLNAGTLIYLFMQKKHEQGPPAGGGAADFIIENLRLDAAQQKQFEEMRHQHQDITRRAHEEDRRLHDIYFSLLKTDNPDKAKVDSVSSLIATQRSMIESATFSHFQQLRQLCRDDQKKLFDATIDEIAKRMTPKGPGPGGPPPGGPDGHRPPPPEQ
jgi:periplasmic protein CpxP/Spy